MKKIKFIVNCLICNKETFSYPNYPKKYCSYACRDIAHHQYTHSQETRNKISKKLKDNPNIHHFIKGHKPWNKGIETPKGNLSCNWKGGKRKHTRGYIEIHSPKHPFRNKQNYVLEHRLVMEKNIGRYLTPSEVVHHINRITDDNRIENLILFKNHSEHRLHHVREK